MIAIEESDVYVFPSRACSVCGRSLPASHDYFWIVDPVPPELLSDVCRDCPEPDGEG